MSALQFLDYDSLQEGVVYTVREMRWLGLHGSTGYFYIIIYESFIHQEHGSTIIVARKKLDI